MISAGSSLNLTLKQVLPFLRTVRSRQEIPEALERFSAGTKKGAYRVTFEDSSTAVLYAWDPAESHWSGEMQPPGLFAEVTNALGFQRNCALLAAIGVRVPHVYGVDVGATISCGGLALVEDITGGSLREMLDSRHDRSDQTLREFDVMLGLLAQSQRNWPGPVDSPGTTAAQLPHDLAVQQALSDLREGARRAKDLAASELLLERRLRSLHGRIRPRTRYGLVHGEIGPEHVLIDGAGSPVMIDIDALCYFDVEWDHAFLRMRFGSHYEKLSVAGLDEHRIEFYSLCLNLSLIAGPLRLLDGGYEDRQEMLEIVDSHLRAARRHLD